MKTFSIQTLGCKVNQYESEQVATLLRARGLSQVQPTEPADLRVVNTCSVTIEAAGKSRSTVRRSTRLAVLQNPVANLPAMQFRATIDKPGDGLKPRVIVTGCWATSNAGEARKIPGVDAVLAHSDDVAGQLDQLLHTWQSDDPDSDTLQLNGSCATGAMRVDESIIMSAGIPGTIPAYIKPNQPPAVKQNPRDIVGARNLPLLDERQSAHQRAFLKIQDGCDAHCTYCIIPQLRPALWSKPIDDVVAEAAAMVRAGHHEIVLTGIFLGAYGQPTALRRRQPGDSDPVGSLGRLIEALCTRLPDLRRLRLSSLEPGDLTDGLLSVLRRHPQVVPHFHLPLQSGSDRLLRKMNRQYSRDDFLAMVEKVHDAFDRPALTTDIIVGFPGETDEAFAETLEVVDRSRFIHVHAFPFSPRPGTAAARWREQFVPVAETKQRMEQLVARAAEHSLAYRQGFVGETVEILVERPAVSAVERPAVSSPEQADDPIIQHGRCERYFDIHFGHPQRLTSRAVRVRIERITAQRTYGSVVEILQEATR